MGKDKRNKGIQGVIDGGQAKNVDEATANQIQKLLSQSSRSSQPGEAMDYDKLLEEQLKSKFSVSMSLETIENFAADYYRCSLDKLMTEELPEAKKLAEYAYEYGLEMASRRYSVLRWVLDKSVEESEQNESEEPAPEAG